MKIALIDQSFHWPPRGGSWIDLRETALRLQQAGDEIRIFTPKLTRWHVPGGQIDLDPGVPVSVIPMTISQFNFWQAPRMIHREVTSWNPDRIMLGNTFFLAPYILDLFQETPCFLRIYAHEMLCSNYMGMCRGNVFKCDQKNPMGIICDGSLPGTPLMCWRCALRRMLPTLVGPRLNEVAFEYFSSLAFLPWYSSRVRRSLSRLAGILVYNTFVHDLAEPFGSPVHIVPAGVDTSRFVPGQRRIDVKRPRILLPGRADDPRKGFSVFADSIDILHSRGHDVEALVTDPRPDFVHPVIQSTGWISPSDLPGLYQSVDIVVCPSIWPEPFGIVPLESMACGVPVVASQAGGMKNSILNGQTGFTFPIGDSVQLADCLECLIRDPQLRFQMGINGRKRAELVFNWDRIIASFTGPILRGETREPMNWLKKQHSQSDMEGH